MPSKGFHRSLLATPMAALPDDVTGVPVAVADLALAVAGDDVGEGCGPHDALLRRGIFCR